MLVSVVIPTYNQRNLLEGTIVSLAEQSYPVSHVEVVIADDGSGDGTGDLIQSLSVPFSLRYLWQENKGRAAARNLGLSAATGDLILFLDADIAAHPCLIEEHVASHEAEERVMIQGQVVLAPDVTPTPFTELVLSCAGANQYVDGDGYLPPTHTATGNLSIKMAHLREIGGFDEGFRRYGWEDVDFGYRASRLGLKLRYNPRAIGYHRDYATDLRSNCQRAYRAAYTAPLLFAKHPELEDEIPMFVDKRRISLRRDPPRLVLKKIARAVLSTRFALGLLESGALLLERYASSSRLLTTCYRFVIGAYLYRGYHQGSCEWSLTEGSR